MSSAVFSATTSRSGGVGLRYDPLGRLYEVATASGWTRFLHDGDALVAEYLPSGLYAVYVHGSNAGADDPLVWYGPGIVRWLHADQQGSIVGLADSQGALAAINRYDEYGIPATDGQGNNVNTGRFQYTGQIWLAELGMYHYKARVYSPTLGRFLQTDPIGYDDQVNLYAYVGNDPVNGTDPSGAARICSGGTGSRIANCVTVDADVDNDGHDDLQRWQVNRISRAYAGFINSNNGANLSGSGKNVTGNADTHHRAMVSVASQFVGAALGNSPHWRNLVGIRATRNGEGMTHVTEEGSYIPGGNGRWTMTLEPRFLSGWRPIFRTSLTRVLYTSPSNLARAMLHAIGHTFINRFDELRVDRYARYALGRYGLSGEGCWGVADIYDPC